MDSKKFTSVDEYIHAFPKETQEVLEKVRQTIKKTIPDAEETISYNIPCYKLNGKYAVYFSGYAKHISVYPRPSDESLTEAMEPYASGAGTLQFPLRDAIPYELIAKVTKALAKDNLERAGY